jgi:hypothetical protein
MKTKLFFLLIGSSLFGQNAELFNNNWYISQIVTNNQTTISPAMQVSIGTSHFNSNTNFVSSYFNTASSMITFNTLTDSFTRQGGGCTLAVYNGTNAAAAQAYDQKNCDFFINTSSGTIFDYQIINNSTSKTLIITNATTGDKIVYNNSLLGTKENILKKTFKVYPNPSSDFLIVEDLEKNLKVKIYDLSGNLLFETLSSGKTLKVDVSDFQKGQYILSIENFRSEFFIKN